VRLASMEEAHDKAGEERLAEVNREFANLKQNLLAGVISPMLVALPSEHKAEKAKLETRLQAGPKRQTEFEFLPTPDLVERCSMKVARVPETLDDEVVRPQAAGVIAQLTESMTLHRPAAKVKWWQRSLTSSPLSQMTTPP